MRTTAVIIAFMLLGVSLGFAKTYTITNSDFTFSPDNLTISLGDTVNFVLPSIHNAIEVSQSTWNADGITSNGGFATPFGGGIVVLKQIGTHYYVCFNHANLGMKGIIDVNAQTGVAVRDARIPSTYSLEQNFPNPFNPATTISFSLPTAQQVTLEVFDVIGRQVGVLVNERKEPGSYTFTFDASGLPSSVYIYELKAGTFVQVRKMTLVK
jgi:plastocyanin